MWSDCNNNNDYGSENDNNNYNVDNNKNDNDENNYENKYNCNKEDDNNYYIFFKRAETVKTNFIKDLSQTGFSRE